MFQICLVCIGIIGAVTESETARLTKLQNVGRATIAIRCVLRSSTSTLLHEAAGKICVQPSVESFSSDMTIFSGCDKCTLRFFA